jgi:Domain of unknown function (DUF4920)
MKSVLVAALVALAVPVVAEETKLGAGVTLKEATAVTALVNHPDQFVGKKVRVDGIVTAVCQEMGCWMAIADEDKADAPTVRIKVEDGAIVFPATAKGKRVSAEGVFEAIAAADAHGTEAAAENVKKDPKASTKYQLKGTGAIIR